MAITEVYVDPSINADSGTGASGTPYGDLEYAVEQTTFDTTNGTRFNIKTGSTETLAANLYTATQDTVTTAAYVPSITAPLIFQGYSTSAGDGGIGVISGGGSVPIFDATAFDYTNFIDLHCHNTGSNKIINIDQTCSLIRCELDNATGSGQNVEVGGRSIILGCHIHNMGGVVYGSTAVIAFNYFENGTNTFVTALEIGTNSVVYRNIFHLSTASNSSIAIKVEDDAATILNNSIWSDAGTGGGIVVINGVTPSIIMNNVIEGFSGTGGNGIEFITTSNARIYGNNAVEACTTEYVAPTAFTIDDLSVSRWGGTNESLSASPFTNATGGDFSPIDTDNIKEGSLPPDFGDGQ